MKQYLSLKNLVFVLALIVFIIGFSAFSQKQKDDKTFFQKNYLQKDNDTSAAARHNRNKDDGNINILDDQMKELDIEMKNLNNQMKQIDFQKFQLEADEAMKKIDVEKITAEIDKAMKDIDFEKINSEIEESAENVRRVDMHKMQQQMEKAKAIFQKQKFNMQIDLQKMKLNFERSMKDARGSLERARQEIKNMNEFTDALDKEGLTDKSKPYKIEVKNGELYIDDKKQSQEINNRYRHYYRKSDFKIDTNERDEIRI